MANKAAIIVHSGDMDKLYSALILGNGALAMDMDVTLFFTMRGLHIVEKGGAEKIRLNGEPQGLSTLMRAVQEQGGRLIACSAFLNAEGLREEDIIDGAEFGGVATFLSGAEEADIVLTF